MNDILRRRLIGLAALLLAAFLLSLLLPRGGPESGEKGVPSVTLPLSANPGGDASEQATPGPSNAAAPAATPAPAPASVTAASGPPPDASAPAPGAPAARPALPPVAAQASQEDAHGPFKLSEENAHGPEKQKMSDSMIAMDPAPQPKPATPVVPMLKPVPVQKPASPKLAMAAPTPAPAPAAPAPGGKSWYVQIGSFSDQNHALTTLSLLQNIGYHGESTQVSTASGANFYRVRLGPFDSETGARQAFDKVSRQGYPQARVLSEGAAK